MLLPLVYVTDPNLYVKLVHREKLDVRVEDLTLRIYLKDKVVLTHQLTGHQYFALSYGLYHLFYDSIDITEWRRQVTLNQTMFGLSDKLWYTLAIIDRSDWLLEELERYFLLPRDLLKVDIISVFNIYEIYVKKRNETS